MTRYASNTSVSSEKSRAEIERTLGRYGATHFMYGWDQKQAVIGFCIEGRQIKFQLPMPDREDPEFTKTSRGRDRTDDAAQKSWEQATRQRWRSLALVIKAKLEAVESGISAFEEEFLANILLPNGSTVGQFMIPQVKIAYDQGTMPALLPGGDS